MGVKPPWFAARRPGLWVYGHAGDLWGKITGREPELNSASDGNVEAGASLFVCPRGKRT